MKIVTIYDSMNECLFQKAVAIALNKEGLKEAKAIADKLIKTLLPKMPSAGLAGPQIGINKQIFIYSWDREIENIEVVINPAIIKFDLDEQISWEACYSAIEDSGICKIALVSRARNIEVEYYNLKGKKIKKILKGFAARVFQHEYDHLLGIVDIYKKDVEVKTFPDKNAMIEFMKKIKILEEVSYIKPSDVNNSL